MLAPEPRGGVRRHVFIAGLAGAAWPLAARAQQSANVPRIGFLRLGPTSSHAGRVNALRTGLRELGYVEGKNIAFEFRWAETVEQLSKFAAELIRINVNIIFATSSTEVGIVQPLTKTIPIVFATHADPIGPRSCGESLPSRREHHGIVDADDRTDR
jgi:putative ABC transport system substrate-binding protein